MHVLEFNTFLMHVFKYSSETSQPSGLYQRLLDLLGLHGYGGEGLAVCLSLSNGVT